MFVVFFSSKLGEILIEQREHVFAHHLVLAHQQLVLNALSKFAWLHLLCVDLR